MIQEISQIQKQIESEIKNPSKKGSKSFPNYTEPFKHKESRVSFSKNTGFKEEDFKKIEELVNEVFIYGRKIM